MLNTQGMERGYLEREQSSQCLEGITKGHVRLHPCLAPGMKDVTAGVIKEHERTLVPIPVSPCVLQVTRIRTFCKEVVHEREGSQIRKIGVVTLRSSRQQRRMV